MTLFRFFIILTLLCVPVFGKNLKAISCTGPKNLCDQINPYFWEFKNKEFDPTQIKLKISKVVSEFYRQGHFDFILKDNLDQISNEDSEIRLEIKVESSEKYLFLFLGSKIFSNQELNLKIQEKFRGDFARLTSKSIAAQINLIYEELGFYGTQIKINLYEGNDLNGIKTKTYYASIEEGRKLPVIQMKFQGLSKITSEELLLLYNAEASDLASRQFYDASYLEKYIKNVKKFYLSKGFVGVEISNVRVIPVFKSQEMTQLSEADRVIIEISIIENRQVFVKSINLNLAGISSSEIEKIKSSMTNTEDLPLNVIKLEDDLTIIKNKLREMGYFFAAVEGINQSSLLEYLDNGDFVNINPRIVLDNLICYRDSKISGLNVTKEKVLFREIKWKDRELISLSSVDELQLRLFNLGLFSNVKVTPMQNYEDRTTSLDPDKKSCIGTHVIITVTEKDFGHGEVALGYRTDLGVKASLGISYNNINGENKMYSIKSQFSHRINHEGVDPARSKLRLNMLEYLGSAKYNNPYVLDNFIPIQIDFESAATVQRRRYYYFDADIFKVSSQLSKNFARHFELALQYQLERILQFNGSAATNNDSYTIGGLTPSLTVDYRDSSVNPKKGAYLNLSSEWANPYFGSLKNSSLEINYIKIIARTRFYFSLSPWVFATSISWGFEKNFADRLVGNNALNLNGVPKTIGYIPNIKLFRLEGFDEIRGFDDGEANRLINNAPIDTQVIQGKAYFMTLKFEPRYSITDSVVGSVFVDAGRVYMDSFIPLKLRTSFGLGLKYLTPVGSIDLDYGIKFVRNNLDANAKETFGRLHLSIGFF